MAGWDYDCVIIGGGPGGLVAALYLRRFRRKVLVINQGTPRAAWIPKTHNLIGYDRGISGRTLLARLHSQLDSVHTERINNSATVLRSDDGFSVELEEGSSVRARKVILATGMEDVHPKIDNVVELRRKGLLRYCSICDGYEYRNQHLAVLAQDDAGLAKALFLRNWSRNVHVLVPEDMKIAPQRLKQIKDSLIRVIHTDALQISAREDIEGICITVNERRKPLFYRVAYIELGCKVRDSAFKNLKKLRRTQAGFIITTNEQRTSIPGLFAVGDCVNLLGQISVAAGQAAVAATTIHNDLL